MTEPKARCPQCGWEMSPTVTAYGYLFECVRCGYRILRGKPAQKGTVLK